MAEFNDIPSVLISQGIITKADLPELRQRAIIKGVPLQKYLVEEEIVTNQQMIQAVSIAGGLEFFDLSKEEINRDAVHRITGDQARRWNVIPVSFVSSEDHLKVAVPYSKAFDLQLVDDLRAATGVKRVTLVVAMKNEIERSIQQFYRSDEELQELGAAEEKEEEQEDLSDFEEVVEDSRIVRFVNLAINQGIADGASDIHIEQDEFKIRIRYRIDGVLHDISSADKSIANEVTSRLKVIANLDIAEKRKPQDGRISIKHHDQKIDLRVSTLPTVWGEKIVLRILDNSQAQFALTDLGFSPYNLRRFEKSFVRPNGLILITGPTGSGKSTTNYATLNQVQSPEINIVTVEDPVEYRIPRINQVQVNPKAGLTFPSALRSILRGDPDVILIGEIRDLETATVAVEAGLTGHLVLSTLHTNSASQAISRLSEMGVEPFLVASVVEAIVAQRLIRKLCKKCNIEYVPTEEEVKNSGFIMEDGEELPTIYKPNGCRECGHTGYRGRTSVHEVLLRSDELEQLAVSGATATDLHAKALEQGMVSLKQDGWYKVKQGITSVAEVLRVVS